MDKTGIICFGKGAKGTGITKLKEIFLMMEAVQTPETSVNSYQSTRRYNPKDSHLHSHRHENLKSI
jgi:hypothetical protein